MATLNDEPLSLPRIGRCKRCGRTLTDHNSIAFEMGPVCRTKEGLIPRPRIRKIDLTIKKPKVHRMKISDLDISTTNLDVWFSEDKEKKEG